MKLSSIDRDTAVWLSLLVAVLVPILAGFEAMYR